MGQTLLYFNQEQRSKLLQEFGFKEEVREVIVGKHHGTGYPDPKKFYHLFWEVYDLSLEEPYFWILYIMKENFPIIEKLEDSFAAAENSAFFGVTQQRLGAQQDKISQLLATTGKMIKELFQMVRELRIIDERLTYYHEVEQECRQPIDQRKKSAEITLKGFFVDLVQGGGKSPASVYGMARELEFITLPDLFFDAPPMKNSTELERHVAALEKNFNKNVLRVLQRHLRQYMEWRIRTQQEHASRRRFMLAYLRQHFDIIKMYLNWIRPYLRHVARLTMKEGNMLSADLVSAFEGSMLDIEVLARVRDDSAKVNGCILATFNYRTRPELKVVQEGYQRGPVHIGKFEMNLRIYGWTDKEVEAYKKMKDKELLYMMGEISASVQQAMESLGSELEKYIEEAKGVQLSEKKAGKEEGAARKSLTAKLLGDFYTPKELKSKKEKVPSRKQMRRQAEAEEEAMKKVLDGTRKVCWNMYKNFKKAHRMVMW